MQMRFSSGTRYEESNLRFDKRTVKVKKRNPDNLVANGFQAVEAVVVVMRSGGGGKDGGEKRRGWHKRSMQHNLP